GASQSNLVLIGRLCVPLAVVVGCVIAPRLADPKYQGAFQFIQEFQGYLSPGVLTVFLFGFFVPWTPRFCGALGLLIAPAIYGALHWWFDMAFLNRMAITVGLTSAVLIFCTLAAPLSKPVDLPKQTKIDMTSSSSSKIFAWVIVAATVVLYVIFW
ncbi:MAG: transporter, partial [Planctomycetota bacterium]